MPSASKSLNPKHMCRRQSACVCAARRGRGRREPCCSGASETLNLSVHVLVVPGPSQRCAVSVPLVAVQPRKVTRRAVGHATNPKP